MARHSRKKLPKMYGVIWFSIYTSLIWNISQSKNNWARYVYRSSCRVSSILVRCEWNLNFLERISKNTETELFIRTDGWTDGQTDMKKLIVSFRNFADASKKQYAGHWNPCKYSTLFDCRCSIKEYTGQYNLWTFHLCRQQQFRKAL